MAASNRRQSGWARSKKLEVRIFAKCLGRTARCIAHVLGRSLGRESALADYGRTSEGEYDVLREEYLRLHNDPGVTESTQELIDWLGTYLIHQQHPEARTIAYQEVYPPRLDNILVSTDVEVRGCPLTVYVPGI